MDVSIGLDGEVGGHAHQDNDETRDDCIPRRVRLEWSSEGERLAVEALRLHSAVKAYVCDGNSKPAG